MLKREDKWIHFEGNHKAGQEWWTAWLWNGKEDQTVALAIPASWHCHKHHETAAIYCKEKVLKIISLII